MTSRPLLAPLGLALALGLAACGGNKSETPSTGAATVTPAAQEKTTSSETPSGSTATSGCSMLTEKEASDICGTKLTYQNNDGGPGCTFMADASTGWLGGISILVQDYNEIAFNVLTKGFTPVAGVGDRALGKNGSLAFVKGGRWASIDVLNPKQGMNADEVARKIGTIVAGRM